MSGGGGASRSFDLEVDLKNGIGYTFSSIVKYVAPSLSVCHMSCHLHRDDYGRLYDFITAKNIKVKNKGAKVVSGLVTHSTNKFTMYTLRDYGVYNYNYLTWYPL